MKEGGQPVRGGPYVFLIVALSVALSITPWGRASAQVTVPTGTQVALRFSAPLDSGTVKEGDTIPFTVASDVVVDRTLIIKQGTPAQGLVVSVTKPGIFGRNARVQIDFVQTAGVDGRPISLAPVGVTPASTREARDTGGAVGASVAGVLLLGPLGLAGGALVRGGHVSVPAGAVAVTSTAPQTTASAQ
jgi:hypothetical protein